MSLITRTGTEPLMPEQASRDIFSDVTARGSLALQKMRKLPNMSRNQMRLPVLSALPTGYFVAGSRTTNPPAHKRTTAVEWANKYVYAEEIAVIIPIGQDVLDDADYPIWDEIKEPLATEFGRVIDAAVFHGTSKPDTWPDGVVTAATAAGNAVALGTGTDLYDDLLATGGVWAAVESDGYLVNGWVGAIPIMAQLRGLRDENGQPIFKKDMAAPTAYTIDGISGDIPDNGGIDEAEALLIAGNWNKLVYSIRQDITYTIHTDGVVQDPDTGAIVYNLMEQDMVALRAVMRLGWQVPNPINFVQRTAESRYPLAVLTPAASPGS